MIVLAALALSNTITQVLAAAGDLDPTFGNGGKVTTDLGSGFDEINSVVVQQDGKIVAGGDLLLFPEFDDVAFALARYNPNGSLDQSFGDGGKVITNFSFSPDEIGALAIQSDGKIVAVGAANHGLGLIRYNSNGSLDVTFGSGGKVLTAINIPILGLAAAIQSDGKILVSSSIGIETPSGSAFLLLRYNSDGSLDSGFGSGGVVTTRFETNSSDHSFALAIEPSGRIVVGGSTFNGVRSAFALALYESSGALVPTFGSAGKVITVTEGFSSGILTLALQSDGGIQAAGAAGDGIGIHTAYTRYDLNGILDPNFGTAGMVAADSLPANDTFIRRMAILADGHIVAAGNTRQFPSDFLAARYNPNGNFDGSFGTGGKTKIDFNGGNDGVGGLAIQVDGKIVIGGGALASAGFDFALVRLEGGPGFDICIQDESNGNLLKINTTTGDYLFTNCGGLTIGGIGSITQRGGLITLQDNRPDRRLLARIDTVARKATATLQMLSVGATFTLTDMNTANDTCVCR